MKDKLESKIGKIVLDSAMPYITPHYAIASSFPTILYATDIETLIRAPYSFYAKKILNLRKLEEVDEQTNLAEFGNFFHLAVDTYCKEYQNLLIDKKSQLITILDAILKNNNTPEVNKQIWKTKFIALSDEFIAFDESRRAQSRETYSEIKGSAEINIAGKNITLKTVADRIEVNHQGFVTIIDFKTGSLPTKKDVLSGISPQMLVEAIILIKGGFNIQSTKVAKLIYVKLRSSKPYITETKFEISNEEILRHEQGLSSLLEHYVHNMRFLTEPNLMKYDNYKHLARRS